MISAKDAKALSMDNSKSNQELALLESAIIAESKRGRMHLALSTGLNAEYRARQDLIFPGFKGRFEDETVRVLRSLGYTVELYDGFQSTSVTIRWEELVDA